MHKSDIEILLENADALKLSLNWLKHSIKLCSKIKDFENLTINEYDHLESLTARFARVTDILFNKVFRSIVLIETGSSKTLLDALFFLSKVNIIENPERARFLKEIRNDIVHDYLQEDLIDLFKKEMIYKQNSIPGKQKTGEYY